MSDTRIRGVRYTHKATGLVHIWLLTDSTTWMALCPGVVALESALREPVDEDRLCLTCATLNAGAYLADRQAAVQEAMRADMRADEHWRPEPESP